MDKTKRNVVALGALTIIAVIVFFWGLYYLLGSTIVRGGMDLVVVMPQGGGLKRGDRALVEGVIVGSVRDIDLINLKQGVVATLRLNRKLDLPIDTRAVVSGDVFGAHTIELRPGHLTQTLERNDTLRGEIAPALMDEASGLAGNARSVLERADRLLSDEAINNIHSTTRELPASAVQLRAALAELRVASASLRRTAAELENSKNGAALNAAIKRIDEGATSINVAAKTLNESILSLKSVFAKVDQGNGTLGRLVNDSSLYVELNNTVREFRLLAADIKANPKRYVDLRIF